MCWFCFVLGENNLHWANSAQRNGLVEIWKQQILVMCPECLRCEGSIYHSLSGTRDPMKKMRINERSDNTIKEPLLLIFILWIPEKNCFYFSELKAMSIYNINPNAIIYHKIEDFSLL